MKNQLAYIAGYIDGDGCFFIGKNFHPIKYRSAIIINSTNINIVRLFKDQFGGQILKNKINPKFKNYNPINTWYFQGKNAIPFIQQILPFLNEKRKDAEIFIDFANEKSKTIKDQFIEKIRSYREFNNLVYEKDIEILNQIQNINEPKEEDFAYLAGFIDAECNFTISKYKPKDRPNMTYKIMLQCNNTKTPVISWLLKTFGGHCYFVPRKNKNPKHKDQIAWRISGRALSKLLNQLIPFLQYKRPVCELLIEFYKTTMDNGGDRHTQEFKSLYQSKMSIRDSIVKKIHTLNSKTIKTI